MERNQTKAQPMHAALFISDLHLQQSHPKTAQAFFRFLQQHAVHAEQFYILGDLFEYWAGDDDIGSDFNRSVIDAIRKVADAGVKLFWIGGNRDFLAGEGFAQATGAVCLSEPHVAVIAGQSIILAHGDAQCVDDHAYIEFRNQVRHPEWQKQFLAMPLEKRKAIIEGMRIDSREEKQVKSSAIMDVSAAAIADLFRKTEASILIHGHTHRPARHDYIIRGRNCQRYVLPEWDFDGVTIQGGWIAIEPDGSIVRVETDATNLLSV